VFVLRTGLQGNGKTLNTIKEVDLKAAKEGRAVYYHNIRGFNPKADVLKGVWEEFADPQKWYELPQNALIVIDEAQTFFRIRKQASAVPEYASALETMRHRGHELHCITQSPGLIDHHFRKLCNSHIHYVRGHKGKIIKRWEFERVNADVERKNHFQEGEATRILLDKSYFGVYQSVADGSEHHMRFKPPKALFVLAGCLLVVGYGGYKLYAQRAADLAKGQTAGHASVSPTQQATTTSITRSKGQPMTLEAYLARHTPRLTDVPSSAPLYDDVTQPVSYPRLSCIATWDINAITKGYKRFAVGMRDEKVYGCRCNTQQGTRAKVSAAGCLNYVENGAFDPAKPDANNLMPQQEALPAGLGAGAVSAAPRHDGGALTSRPIVP